MDEYQDTDRRESVRKRVSLPIKLMAKRNIVSRGQLLDISCYGIKLEIMFMSNQEKAKVEQSLSTHNIILEIGEAGDRLHVKVPVDVKWSKSKVGEILFEAGMDLTLGEEDKQGWQQFYDAL